jgi:catechol-2,3-dioxygenase
MDKIHHIAIQVNNLDNALSWYKSNFNVEVTYQDDTWAMIQFDNVALALVTPTQHPPHFAITCENLEKFGTPKKHRDNTSSVYIKDPEGNVVEMIKL